LIEFPHPLTLGAARNTMHPVGVSPTRGISQLVPVALSGVLKEVTRKTWPGRTGLGGPAKAEVGGPGGLRWVGPQHNVNTAAS